MSVRLPKKVANQYLGGTQHVNPSSVEASERIERDIQDFLDKGNSITELSPSEFGVKIGKKRTKRQKRAELTA